jgi:hypothetical protein
MTTREIKAWEKAKAKAIRTAKEDLKKSDGWRLGEFSKMYAYDMDFKLVQKNGDWLIKKFVFLCESHHGFCEVWTWTVEVDIDLRKKAVIVDRNVREVK